MNKSCNVLSVEEIERILVLENITQNDLDEALKHTETLKNFVMQARTKLSARSASIASQERETPSPTELRGHQPKAFAAISAWLKDKKAFSMFALLGVAGAGKSTLVSYLLKDKNISLSHVWHLTATTNKAAGNLASITGNQLSTTTVHSKLGLVMEEMELQVVLVKKGPAVNFSSSDIIVVDEASQATKQLLHYLKQTRAKILFIGDPYQLPPVGEDSCCAFDVCIENKSFVRMTQVLRFDSDLLDLSIKIREAIKAEDESFSVSYDNVPAGSTQISVCDSQADFESRILELKSPSDFISTKVLAWRNKTVARYNKMIRTNLGFINPFYPGEVICNSEPIYQTDTIVCTIDSDLVVVEVEEDFELNINLPHSVEGYSTTSLTIECIRLRVELNGYSIGDIYVPNTIAGSKYSRTVNELAKLASAQKGLQRTRAWKNFWYFKQKFTPVRYSYCSTVHKIQGATLDTAFVDQNDILANKSTETALRCLYVACTRPKNSLVIY